MCPVWRTEPSFLLLWSRSINKTHRIEKEEYKEGSPPTVKAELCPEHRVRTEPPPPKPGALKGYTFRDK